MLTLTDLVHNFVGLTHSMKQSKHFTFLVGCQLTSIVLPYVAKMFETVTVNDIVKSIILSYIAYSIWEEEYFKMW